MLATYLIKKFLKDICRAYGLPKVIVRSIMIYHRYYPLLGLGEIRHVIRRLIRDGVMEREKKGVFFVDCEKVLSSGEGASSAKEGV
ncbi:MAG: hypothetical protein QXQ91_04660 [Nanopusillaceae archaeon]